MQRCTASDAEGLPSREEWEAAAVELAQAVARWFGGEGAPPGTDECRAEFDRIGVFAKRKAPEIAACGTVLRPHRGAPES